MALMLVFLIGNTLTAFAPSLFWLFVSRILTASVAGAIISLILVFVSIVAPMEKRAMLVAATFAGFSIATIIGVPIGTAISNVSSWHVSFLVISILTLIVGALLIWLTPKDSPQSQSTLLNQVNLLTDRRIYLGIIVMIALMTAEYTFYTYIRPIITGVLGYSNTQLSFLLGVIGITFILGNTCAGVIVNHFGITKLTWISTGIFILLLLMDTVFHVSWMGLALLCLICFLLGMPGSILQVMFLNVADKDYPQAINLSSSLNPICTNIGVSLGSMTASIGVNFLPIGRIGYIGAIFALIAIIGSHMLIQFSKQ